jgi:hypothetical protein
LRIRWSWLAEGGGDKLRAQHLGAGGEVIGRDFGELLFGQDEGAEVEALDFGAVFHVVAGDGSGERGDEGLRVDGVVGGGLAGCGGQELAGFVVGEREDFGFDVEADFGGVGGALLGMGLRFAGAFAVVVHVEGGEAEELLDVGGDVGADEVLVLGEGYGYGREGEVVLLVGELGGVELVADEGALGFGAGDVAKVDAVVEGVGRSVGAAAGLRVVELIVPDEGDVVGGDAGVGLESGAELVEAGLEGGQGVFGAQAAASTVRGDIEGAEVGGVGGVGCGFFFDDGAEEVGAVGDDAVNAKVDEGAHLFGVVGGPGDDLEAGFLELGDVNGRIGAEEGGVDGREDGDGRAVGFCVVVGGGHEAEIGVGGHGGGLLGCGDAGDEGENSSGAGGERRDAHEPDDSGAGLQCRELGGPGYSLIKLKGSLLFH